MELQQEKGDRERRHKQLLYLIDNYHPSEEQEDYLRTIKNNTQIEIASRFKKSKHNQNYRFPFVRTTEREDSQSQEDRPTGMSFEHTTYDLRSQNNSKNNDFKPQPAPKIDQGHNKSRRVKSLGSQKLNEKVLRDVRQQLRERPQQRGGQRDRINLPSINSQRILTHSQPKSYISISSSQKALIKSREQSPRQNDGLKKTNNYERIQQILAKDHNQRKLGQLVGHKLLTQSNDLISFGKAKVHVNKLRLASPVRYKNPSGKKLITQ